METVVELKQALKRLLLRQVLNLHQLTVRRWLERWRLQVAMAVAVAPLS